MITEHLMDILAYFPDQFRFIPQLQRYRRIQMPPLPTGKYKLLKTATERIRQFSLKPLNQIEPTPTTLQVPARLDERLPLTFQETREG